jgi:hypothetical protein
MPDFVPNVILPERFRDANVIVVNSPEHQELLKKADNAAKLKKEIEDLQAVRTLVDEQLRNNEEIKSKLLQENQELNIAIRDKRATILKLYLIIGGLTLAIIGLLKLKFF